MIDQRQMRSGVRNSLIWGLMMGLMAAGSPAGYGQDAPEIRAQAVIHLGFDEEQGDALDTAAGDLKANGTLQNGAVRIKSPFRGQADKKALQLDGTKQQSVQIPDGADTDHPTGTTVSFLYVNLETPTDPGYHGLFAKRAAAAPFVTNYGINFTAAGDNLQLYINDGTGFRTINYSVKETLGFRKPVYVTALWEVADAPAPDDDTDADDVRIQLFINGKPMTPKQALNGTIVGNDGWLINLNPAGLLNDVPLTIGTSFTGGEPASGVFDEFLVFPRALKADEITKLLAEVGATEAGPPEGPPTPPAPTLTQFSTQGLQAGGTRTLVVAGENLLPEPRLLLPVGWTQEITEPAANRFVAHLTIPAEMPIGHYPIRVQTANGLSNVLPLAVDSLPHLAAEETTAEKPAALPFAASGQFSGAAQPRVYFTGKAGTRVIADLECRRLGGQSTPVVEVKSLRGTPLGIGWGRIEHNGDARAEAKLPADGIYYVEIHDLAYRAPGANPFRLKVGDLKLADATFPRALPRGTTSSLQLLGPGLDGAAAVPLQVPADALLVSRTLPLPAALGIAAPAPMLAVSDAVEIVEAPAQAGQLQMAELGRPGTPSLAFNGRIAVKGERDRLIVKVVPGDQLRLSIATRSIFSPLIPEIVLLAHPGDQLLAAANDPVTHEPTLNYDVPAGIAHVQILVRDARNTAGPHHLYRARLEHRGPPDFQLALDKDLIQPALDGSALTQVTVTRNGYAGPVTLQVADPPGWTVSPTEIPAGITTAFVVLTPPLGQTAGTVAQLQLIGTATGVTPPLARVVLMPARAALLEASRDRLTASLATPRQLTLALGDLPAAVFRGVDIDLPLELTATDPAMASRIARVTLRSDEKPRRNDPNDPNKGNKPLVASVLNEMVAISEAPTTVKIEVPADIAEPTIGFVIEGEILDHVFAQNVRGTLVTAPFRLPVQNAVTVQPPASPLQLKGAAETKITGSITRTAGFTGPVNVELAGLPAGYTAPRITLAPDQTNFELAVTAPAVTAAADLPNIVLRVTSVSNKSLVPDMPQATKVSP